MLKACRCNMLPLILLSSLLLSRISSKAPQSISYRKCRGPVSFVRSSDSRGAFRAFAAQHHVASEARCAAACAQMLTACHAAMFIPSNRSCLFSHRRFPCPAPNALVAAPRATTGQGRVLHCIECPFGFASIQLRPARRRPMGNLRVPTQPLTSTSRRPTTDSTRSTTEVARQQALVSLWGLPLDKGGPAEDLPRLSATLGPTSRPRAMTTPRRPFPTPPPGPFGGPPPPGPFEGSYFYAAPPLLQLQEDRGVTLQAGETMPSTTERAAESSQTEAFWAQSRSASSRAPLSLSDIGAQWSWTAAETSTATTPTRPETSTATSSAAPTASPLLTSTLASTVSSPLKSSTLAPTASTLPPSTRLYSRQMYTETSSHRPTWLPPRLSTKRPPSSSSLHRSFKAAFPGGGSETFPSKFWPPLRAKPRVDFLFPRTGVVHWTTQRPLQTARSANRKTTVNAVMLIQPAVTVAPLEDFRETPTGEFEDFKTQKTPRPWKAQTLRKPEAEEKVQNYMEPMGLVPAAHSVFREAHRAVAEPHPGTPSTTRALKESQKSPRPPPQPSKDVILRRPQPPATPVTAAAARSTERPLHFDVSSPGTPGPVWALKRNKDASLLAPKSPTPHPQPIKDKILRRPQPPATPTPVIHQRQQTSQPRVPTHPSRPSATSATPASSATPVRGPIQSSLWTSEPPTMSTNQPRVPQATRQRAPWVKPPPLRHHPHLKAKVSLSRPYRLRSRPLRRRPAFPRSLWSGESVVFLMGSLRDWDRANLSSAMPPVRVANGSVTPRFKFYTTPAPKVLKASNETDGCRADLRRPCEFGFGLGCLMAKDAEGCEICSCPFRSPARGCAGPQGLEASDRERLLHRQRRCPADPSGRPPRRAQIVTRYYRRMGSGGRRDVCAPVQQPYCGWTLDVGTWRMPRTMAECQVYCFADLSEPLLDPQPGAEQL